MKQLLDSDFPGRLVELHQGARGLREGLHVRASKPSSSVVGNAPIVDFLSSDETLDRYGEVITAAGWKLENYQRDPVFQDSHDYSSVCKTIGKALITEVQGNKLYQRVKFAVAENPLAKVAYELYAGGFLQAVSVGFIPLKWENGNPDDGFRRKYVEQELLETSAVSIPANPNALQLAVKSGAIRRSDLKELEALLKHLGKAPATPDEDSIRAGSEEILTLLNQVRIQLRHS